MPKGWEFPVGNVSRNVILHSEHRNTLSRRAHVMFMHVHDRPTIVDGALFLGLGRTDARTVHTDPRIGFPRVISAQAQRPVFASAPLTSGKQQVPIDSPAPSEWQVGTEILIRGTVLNNAQNERVTIATISSDRRTHVTDCQLDLPESCRVISDTVP